MDIDNAVDISTYIGYATAYNCPKDGIVRMYLRNDSVGTIGLREGVDILRATSTVDQPVVMSMPVKKGQGVMVHYNTGGPNEFKYYPYK